jgi:hypothetical protein
MPVPSPIPVYLEIGAKRVFAGALEWPGWSRSERDEDGALEALLAYGPRYRRALGSAARGLVLPESASTFDVRERLDGNANTDFGVPGIAPAADSRPVHTAELERELGILGACWRAFDRAARAARGSVLATGPRGGGRELDGIVRHVLDADYLNMLGVRYARGAGTTPADARRLRSAIIEALDAAPRSSPAPAGPRGGKRWTIRYFVRRSAWHALDHTWEIEDRASAR